MNHRQIARSDVNELIIERLRAYPADVAELAIRAVQLSESLPEPSVVESLQSAVREIVRRGTEEK